MFFDSKNVYLISKKKNHYRCSSRNAKQLVRLVFRCFLAFANSKLCVRLPDRINCSVYSACFKLKKKTYYSRMYRCILCVFDVRVYTSKIICIKFMFIQTRNCFDGVGYYIISKNPWGCPRIEKKLYLSVIYSKFLMYIFSKNILNTINIKI